MDHYRTLQVGLRQLSRVSLDQINVTFAGTEALWSTSNSRMSTCRVPSTTPTAKMPMAIDTTTRNVRNRCADKSRSTFRQRGLIARDRGRLAEAAEILGRAATLDPSSDARVEQAELVAVADEDEKGRAAAATRASEKNIELWGVE